MGVFFWWPSRGHICALLITCVCATYHLFFQNQNPSWIEALFKAISCQFAIHFPEPRGVEKQTHSTTVNKPWLIDLFRDLILPPFWIFRTSTTHILLRIAGSADPWNACNRYNLGQFVSSYEVIGSIGIIYNFPPWLVCWECQGVYSLHFFCWFALIQPGYHEQPPHWTADSTWSLWAIKPWVSTLKKAGTGLWELGDTDGGSSMWM